jgi:hypothetical protein
MNSTTEPGHPCVTMSGRASGSGERTCRKWMEWPWIVVVKGEAVQVHLGGAPVVGRTPVVGQALQVAERDSAAPADAGQLFGPARSGQAVAQIVEVGLGDVDAERPNSGSRAVSAALRIVRWLGCCSGHAVLPHSGPAQRFRRAAPSASHDRHDRSRRLWS